MISVDQLENLYKVLEQEQIKINWLLNALEINRLSDINVRQYNFILLIIKRSEINE